MWLLDSGASFHFTSDIKDFIEYHNFSSPHYTQTANCKAPIIGHGTVLISYHRNIVQLLPTIYMPTCHVKLISLGILLKDECLSRYSSKNLFTLYDNCSKKDLITFHSWWKHYVLGTHTYSAKHWQCNFYNECCQLWAFTSLHGISLQGCAQNWVKTYKILPECIYTIQWACLPWLSARQII